METRKGVVGVDAHDSGKTGGAPSSAGATEETGDVIAVLHEPRDIAEPKENRGIGLSGVGGTDPNAAAGETDTVPAVSVRVSAGEPREVPSTSQTSNRVRVVEMSNMQKIMAERMSKSKSTAPHFYMSVEVDMDNVTKQKHSMQGGGVDIKLTYTPFIVKAAGVALQEFPMLNARILPDYMIELHDYVNVGVAVSTDRGLVVPVVKGVDRIGIVEIARSLRELITRAKKGRLTLDDLSGGTFTVSNAGMYGVLQFAAVINPPESAILSVGAITKRPVIGSDGIVEKPLCVMTVSADHRLVDGAVVAGFLGRLKYLLEAPQGLVSR